MLDCQLLDGSVCAVLAEGFSQVSPPCWLAHLVATGSKVLIFLRDASRLDCFRATLWNFEAKLNGSLTTLHQTEQSSIWKHPEWRPEHCVAFREACAGAGALGLGLVRAVLQLCARNALQQVTAEVLRQQGLAPTICGDICDPQTVKALGEANFRPSGLCASA